MRELTPAGLAARFPVLFGSLDEASSERVIAALQPLSFEDAATVLARGEHSNALYLIWSGRLAVVLHVGSELLTLAERGEGEWVGELSLLDPDVVTADVVSVSQTTTLLRLSSEDFRGPAEHGSDRGEGHIARHREGPRSPCPVLAGAGLAPRGRALGARERHGRGSFARLVEPHLVHDVGR